jgi:hypothetical protein
LHDELVNKQKWKRSKVANSKVNEWNQRKSNIEGGGGGGGGGKLKDQHGIRPNTLKPRIGNKTKQNKTKSFVVLKIDLPIPLVSSMFNFFVVCLFVCLFVCSGVTFQSFTKTQ